MSPTLALAKQLISRESITPFDDQCQEVIAKHLQRLNFTVEHLKFGDTDNLWAHLGTKAPLFVFAGHTDVVPTGPKDKWQYDPFTPTVHDDILYGRGATDMKSGLAAMLISVENFLKKHPNFDGSLGFLITSDEEGTGHDGTQKVMAELAKRKIHIDYCIVGEASSDKCLGDQIRVGRRGSYHGKLSVYGKQGHIAYPHLADNPIHRALHALLELTLENWDDGDEHFPPSSFQISNIHAGTGAANVIPGALEVQFNFRFSPAVSVDSLTQRVESILKSHHLHFKIEWYLSGTPFLSKLGNLLKAVQDAVQDLTGLDAALSTGGGTSDARFIAPTGTEVIELGPIAAPAHQVDEHISIKDLNKLTEIYEKTLENLFFQLRA